MKYKITYYLPPLFDGNLSNLPPSVYELEDYLRENYETTLTSIGMGEITIEVTCTRESAILIALKFPNLKVEKIK